MDEVDQLLDLGFQAEVEALVKECPRGRQTLLFSATMTPKVRALS
jgi:superfamily II DNA/RNA helicase